MMRIDARIPLRFGSLEDRRPGEAVLTDHAQPTAPSARFTPTPETHTPDCACCNGRTNAALALAALFRDRAIGPMFHAVLASATPAAEAEIRAAIESDPIVSTRYRLLTTS